MSRDETEEYAAAQRAVDRHARRHFLGGVLMLIGFTCLLLLGVAALASATVVARALALPLLIVSVLVLLTTALPHLLLRRRQRHQEAVLIGSALLLKLWLTALAVLMLVLGWPRWSEVAALGATWLLILAGMFVSGLMTGKRAPGADPFAVRAEWIGLNLTLILVLPLAVLVSWTIQMKAHRLLRASGEGDLAAVRRSLGGLFVPLAPRDAQGRTPLHHAAQFGRVDVVALLLEGGAPVGARDHAGRTPLHFAASAGQAPVAGRLLRAGASVAAVDHGGRTPCDLAREGGYPEVVRLLCEQRPAEGD